MRALFAACRRSTQATNFPGPTGLGASFNRSLWRLKGSIISTEQRAQNNAGNSRGYEAPYSKIGLTGFGPNINIARDPRSACLRQPRPGPMPRAAWLGAARGPGRAVAVADCAPSCPTSSLSLHLCACLSLALCLQIAFCACVRVCARARVCVFVCVCVCACVFVRVRAPYSHLPPTLLARSLLCLSFRFGRISELPGEDPYLTGTYAVEMVQGMQWGEDSKYTKIAAGLKHFTV